MKFGVYFGVLDVLGAFGDAMCCKEQEYLVFEAILMKNYELRIKTSKKHYKWIFSLRS